MYHKIGLSVLLIGHPRHEEVDGVMGELPGLMKVVTSIEDAESVQVTDSKKVGVITQTTLSVDDAREIWWSCGGGSRRSGLRRLMISALLPRIGKLRCV